jgi:serine/threonine protein kinase
MLIAVELCVAGDLEHALANRCRWGATWRPWEICEYVKQLLSAVASMHGRGVVHRDIKPANILLDYNCGAKLCDFGLARNRPSTRSNEEMAEYVTNHPSMINNNRAKPKENGINSLRHKDEE